MCFKSHGRPWASVAACVGWFLASMLPGGARLPGHGGRPFLLSLSFFDGPLPRAGRLCGRAKREPQGNDVLPVMRGVNRAPRAREGRLAPRSSSRRVDFLPFPLWHGASRGHRSAGFRHALSRGGNFELDFWPRSSCRKPARPPRRGADIHREAVCGRVRWEPLAEKALHSLFRAGSAIPSARRVSDGRKASSAFRRSRCAWCVAPCAIPQSQRIDKKGFLFTSIRG